VGTRIALGADGPFDSDRFVTIVAPLRGRGGARRRGRAALAVPIPDLRAGLGGHRHRSLSRANTAARAAARGGHRAGCDARCRDQSVRGNPVRGRLDSVFWPAMLLSHLLRLPDTAKLAGYVSGIVVINHGTIRGPMRWHRVLETGVGIGLAVLVALVPKLIRIDGSTRQDS